MVFSGDLGRPGTPIIRDPTSMTEGDIVLCESTYGGREHEPAEQAAATLAEVVNDAVRRKGALLIPSFAIGRTQEIVWALSRLLDEGRIPQLPVYLDSPMAKSASEIYRDHPESYDEETATLLAEPRGAARLSRASTSSRTSRSRSGSRRLRRRTWSSPRTGC